MQKSEAFAGRWICNAGGVLRRGVERSFVGWFGSADGGGDRHLRGRLRRRRHGSQSTGMVAGVKPRSREAVRHSRRALRATTVPVKMNVGCQDSIGDVAFVEAPNVGFRSAFGI